MSQARVGWATRIPLRVHQFSISHQDRAASLRKDVPNKEAQITKVSKSNRERPISSKTCWVFEHSVLRNWRALIRRAIKLRNWRTSTCDLGVQQIRTRLGMKDKQIRLPICQVKVRLVLDHHQMRFIKIKSALKVLAICIWKHQRTETSPK